MLQAMSSAKHIALERGNPWNHCCIPGIVPTAPPRGASTCAPQNCAEEDWAEDSKGEEILGEQEFFDALFQLVGTFLPAPYLIHIRVSNTRM